MAEQKDESMPVPMPKAPRIKRLDSIFAFQKPIEKQRLIPLTVMIARGADLLAHPRYNKGLAFTWQERKEFNLHGLLPPAYQDLVTQAERVIANVRAMENPLDKFMYFMSILDTNEKLFYQVLCENLFELMPIVYTPTVGEACQKFGYIFTRPRGMFISIRDRRRIYQMLKNWPHDNVRAICFTDGERILGLGDLGACGMGIPIGKLALYTAVGGVRPDQLLPITLDVGCNRKELREDDFYIGIRQERVRGTEYDQFIDEFLLAVSHRWGPTTLVQFEDFGNINSFRLLEKYRNKYCTFNDDIQGTAGVALAGIISSLRMPGSKIKKLNEHTILMYGAGSAGIGIADLISYAMSKETNSTVEECRKNIWLVDSRGLIFKDRKSGGITAEKSKYAHEWNGGEIKPLLDIVKAVKATCLMGVSGRPKSFNEGIVRAVFANNPRPLIFPMSNPTSMAECTAEEAFKWSDNNCIFASGSPFPPLMAGDVKIVPSQGNNAYIFPGLALGVIASKSSRVTDDMFLAAAYALCDAVTDDMLKHGAVYPPIEQIREVSVDIACAVAEEAYSQKLATEVYPEDMRELIKSNQYDHTHHSLLHEKAFDNLEQDFS